MKLDRSTWLKVSKLLDRYFDQAPAERAEWVVGLGSEYSELQPALRQMLAEADRDDAFLSTLPKVAESAFDLSPGQRLGAYRIVSTLGRGGMGVVYAGERDDGTFGQRVAIKLLSASLNSPAFAERLQREYRILARLEHPNIARILDAGATADGLPFFVMEYIEGQPVDQFCAEHKLSIRERLQLFLSVCDAIQFAHQNLVVHRDLKPDNILVTEQGIPKLLDFGIAKILNEVPAPDHTTVMAMTPEYASPEQVRGEPAGTATDVYSLGCVLYKLLAGVTPHQLYGKSAAEAVRSVCEGEPPKPSSLNRELGDDEDNILRTAMQKDTRLRYRSVEQFAADVTRVLRNEPVLARPANTVYRVRKYVRRHRAGVAIAAGILMLLATFGGIQVAELRRITRERDRADRITGFMSLMFKVSDPSEARGNSITAREILDRASREIESGLTSDPELQAQMMGIMGQVYGNLGLYGRAHVLLARTLALRRKTLGEGNEKTLGAADSLALNLNREGRYPDAEKLQRETLLWRRSALGPQHRDTLRSMSSLANTLALAGRYRDAEKLQRETLEVQRRVLGPENSETLRSATNLANTLNREGNYREAESLQRSTLEAQRRVLGAEHPETLGSLGNLAHTVYREDRYPEAEKLLTETLDSRRRVQGPEHPDTLVALTDLAACLKREHRLGDAEKLERQALEIQQRSLGPEHPATLTSMNNLANTLNLEGSYIEAESILRKALTIKQRVLGPEHPETLRSMVNLATSLRLEGHCSEAEKMGKEALQVRRRVLGQEHPDVALAAYNLAIVEECQGKRAEALTLLREAVDHGLSAANSLGMEKDTDLRSLHGDPRFNSLVAYAKQHAADKKPK